ncbi:hypothetical protein ABBQ38_003276 [Trebouxia sp. C0009 RCD-2024]
MPIVPEKLNSRQEVRNAISSQFWDQTVHSVRSLDGTARTLACEPPPVGQTGASGLVRSQELLTTQAAGVPLMPGFCKHHGGVVLDRVLARVGGRQWWANLSGRAKAQQIWAAHQSGAKVGDALKDLNNYGLSARGRYAFGRNATLNYVLEAPNAEDLRSEFKATSSEAKGRDRKAGKQPAVKSQAWAKYQLPGHDLVGSAAWNQEYVDSAASYNTVPMAMSLDLASKDRPDGIQYRAGLHQVSAAEVEGLQTGIPGEAGQRSTVSAGQWRSSLHVQGAVAVEGEAHLWRPGRRGSTSSAPTSPAPPPQGKQDGAAPQDTSVQQQDNAAAEPTGEAQPQAHAHTAAAGQSQQQAAAGPSQETSQAVPQQVAESIPASPSAQSPPSDASKQPEISFRQALAQQEAVMSEGARPSPASRHLAATQEAASTRSGGAPSAARPSSSSEDPVSHAAPPLEGSRHPQGSAASTAGSTSDRPSSTGTLREQRAWPVVNRRRGQESNGLLIDKYSAVVSDSDTSDEEEVLQSAPLLGNISAKSIQSGITEAQSNVDRLRQILDNVTSGVQEGRAEHQQQRQLALSRRHKPVPYSPWLSQPFLKVNAAVGCLARMPLPHAAFKPVQHQASSPSRGKRQQHQERAASRFGSELWAPYLRDTALRVFGSVGVTGQLGHFCRPVLDFTAGSVRLDFGLTSPHHVNTPAAASSYGNLSVFNPREDHLDTAPADEPSYSQRLRFKNRAFALEGRGIWHALSASITQQVIGPVRARADFRYALDLPSSIPQGPDGKRTWHNIREAAGQTRPTLLETVYGLDVIIPGTGGTARAALWYSPVRKEAMAEIKLF